VPIAQHLRSATGLPTFVDNDANALALGEWRFGVGRGDSSMVLLAIGTDVGGGVILNDALVRGACGYAGELGHAAINFDGPECFCGGRGCLAMYLGGRQIAKEARRQVHSGVSSGLLDRVGGDAFAITSELVFAAAADGDPLAAELVSRACEALGAAVGGIVNALNPELIVVTGGVAQSIAPLEKDVLRRAARYALARPLEATRFCVLPGDKRYTVRGGAALALYELDRRNRRTNP
jgi:glucokinase